MDYPARLSMGDLRRPSYLGPERVPDPLMSETDPQRWDFPTYSPQDASAYPEALLVRRVSRSGRDDYPLRGELFDLFQCDLVVPQDERFRAERTHILRQVVDERIIVVQDEYLQLGFS